MLTRGYEEEKYYENCMQSQNIMSIDSSSSKQQDATEERVFDNNRAGTATHVTLRVSLRGIVTYCAVVEEFSSHDAYRCCSMCPP